MITNSIENAILCVEILKKEKNIVFQLETIEGIFVKDILISLNPKQLTHLNRINFGENAVTILYISILGIGSFGFNIEEDYKFYSSYISEKLNLDLQESETICDFLNNLIKFL